MPYDTYHDTGVMMPYDTYHDTGVMMPYDTYHDTGAMLHDTGVICHMIHITIQVS